MCGRWTNCSVFTYRPSISGDDDRVFPRYRDITDTAAYLPSDLCIPRGGILMGEQENPSALDCRKRGCVTAAELLQMSLLLWRELDGILGQRSWHKDSPPDYAQVSRMVICQDLVHVKPTTYLLRTVLRSGDGGMPERQYAPVL